jgi:hypothetical protein
LNTTQEPAFSGGGICFVLFVCFFYCFFFPLFIIFFGIICFGIYLFRFSLPFT